MSLLCVIRDEEILEKDNLNSPNKTRLPTGLIDLDPKPYLYEVKSNISRTFINEFNEINCCRSTRQYVLFSKTVGLFRPPLAI